VHEECCGKELITKSVIVLELWKSKIPFKWAHFGFEEVAF